MRTLEPQNAARTGLIGLVVTVLVTIVGQSMTSVPMLTARAVYYGQFVDSGELSSGDKVRITGITVGDVQEIKIEGDHALVKFSTGTHTFGTESRLAIKTDTILGKKVLELDPRGEHPLRPGGVLPLEQGSTPYQIYEAVFDVTKAASGWPIDTVKDSLKVLSQTVEETAPHLNAALDGVARFSDTVGRRDTEIKHLLDRANQAATVIGDRSDQIDRLLVNTNALLAAFNQRGRAVDALLGNVANFSTQLKGLIGDNPNINRVLEQLRTVSGLVLDRKDDVADTLVQYGKFILILNEAVASGPYFKVSVSNFAPGYQIAQPWVDAAFKKRGILPEEFWRNAGLPEFRYPDPNGIRFPNGAPPPAPALLEGTPEHPGPAVVPGSPCSFAPGPGQFPTPGNPLPCAGLDQQLGPFGYHGGEGPYPGGLPDVLTSPPNPDGLPASPGIAGGGRPGETAPVVPGTPVPLPPDAPQGARREPPGPVSGPIAGNPGAASPGAPMAPGLPGPPAPPGPGEQLPAPFITPGQGGNSQPGGGGGAAEGR